MNYDLNLIRQKSAGEQKENKKLFKQLRKVKVSHLDGMIHQLHVHYMSQVNCLDCGNCCKSISPAVKDADITRLAKHMKIKPSELTERYFQLDEDGDYVFKSQPCPFLGDDNYCSVYEARPRACREYPHTDRVKIHQILDITFRNISVCPVVYEIVQDLKKDYS